MTSPWPLLFAVFMAHLAATASPGPNVLLVLHQALSQRRRTAVAAALGVACGAAVWSVAALWSLGLVAQRFPQLGTVLRWAGAGYLLLLGWRLWRSAASDTGSAAAAPLSPAQGFARGLLTNLGNPKALLFYGGVFAGLVGPRTPSWVQAAAVTIVVVNSALWHISLACFFATPRAQRAYRHAKPAIDRSASVLFIALGLWLAAL